MSISRSPLNPEGSEFLRNLRETTKMNSKLLDGIHSATLPKKSKTSDISPIPKKTSSSRNSHPFYFPNEPQSAHLPSQSPLPTHKKSPSKIKNSPIAIYHLSNGAYGLSNSKPKLVTSISAVELETEDHHVSQTMIHHPVHVSAFQKFAHHDPSPPKSYSRSPIMGRGEYTGARDHSSHAHSQQPHGTSVYKTKGTNKARKISNNSKSRALSGMKYNTKDTKTLPHLALLSQRRGLNSAAPVENKKPVRNVHSNVQSTHNLDQHFASEGDDATTTIEQHVTKEKKRNMPSELTSPLKPSHPLREIKIDISNFIDQPMTTTAAIVENKKVVTNRNVEHIILASQRPEKNKTELSSTTTTRNNTGVSPHSVSTPQTSNINGLIKAKLAANTSKQDVIMKKNAYKSQMTEEERKLYGDRFLEDYEKIDFLGRGGFALVWLGIERKTGKKVAVKQILKGAGTESQKKELYYGQSLFGKDALPHEEIRQFAGIKSIASFIEHKTTRHDEWIVSELGGKTLSKHLFDIKGEFYKGERIYRVKYGELSQAFKRDNFTLKAFIRQMAQVLHLLSEKRIVHCDLKPDNILINLDQYRAGKPLDLKVIDFGSAYTWDEVGNIGMATPEYMPPEFLSALLYRKGMKSSIEQLNEITNPWSIDIWSLGAIVLEIITGVPLWMSLKCRLEVGSKSTFGMGLFAVKGRAYDKILQRQRSVMESLGDVLVEHLGPWADREALFDLISHMMEWDPMNRISPEEILQHPYLNESHH